jgi:hypothetical protein
VTSKLKTYMVASDDVLEMSSLDSSSGRRELLEDNSSGKVT